jgi:hypothetical protein
VSVLLLLIQPTNAQGQQIAFGHSGAERAQKRGFVLFQKNFLAGKLVEESRMWLVNVIDILYMLEIYFILIPVERGRFHRDKYW